MNWLDIVLGLVLLAAFLVGWRLGGLFLVGVALALVLAPWLADLSSPRLAHLIQGWFKGNSGEKLAYWGIFLLVCLLIFLAFRLWGALADAVGLGLLDRLTGAAATSILCFLILAALFRSAQFHVNADKAAVLRKSWFCSRVFPKVRVLDRFLGTPV
jgi:membrane protein required for colicin V production